MKLTAKQENIYGCNCVDTRDSLLKRADNARYEAKKNERDRWVVASLMKEQ